LLTPAIWKGATTGALEIRLVPTPTATPQHHTSPRPVSAQVWKRPAASVLAPLIRAVTGVNELLVEQLPSWPMPLLPQQ
jgi:hypothetical protein